MGVAGLNREGQPVMICMNLELANHNSMEGVPEEDSKHWWIAPDVDIFARFLMGDVRSIMEKQRKIDLAAIDAKGSTSE